MGNMVSQTDQPSVEPEGSGNTSGRTQTDAAGKRLDSITVQKILDTIRASRNFIEDAELAKQCRSVIDYYYSIGDYVKVIDTCSLVLISSLGPSDCCVLATSHIMTGGFETARNLIASYEWKGGEDYRFIALGRLLFSQGREPEAKAHFEEAIKVNPANAEALTELLAHWPDDEFTIRARSGAQDREREHGAEQGIVTEGIDAGGVKHESSADDVAGLYSQQLRTDAAAIFALGIGQLEKNETDQGLSNIEESLRNGAPRRPEVMKRLALAYTASGGTGRAIEAIEYVTKSGLLGQDRLKGFELELLETSRAHRNYEIMLLATGRLLLRDKENAKFIDARLDALSGLERYEEAIAFLERHKQARGYEKNKMILLRRAGKLAEAESIADRQLLSESANHEALFTKLYAANKKGEGRSALKRFESVVLRHGNEKVLKLFLEIAKSCGQDLLVLKACQSLLSAGSNSVEILSDRATAVERLGRFNQSRRLLKRLYRKHRSEASLRLLTTFYARHARPIDEERVLKDAYSTMQLPVALLERLAKLKMDKGEEEEALHVIASAMEKKETPEGRYLHAEVLLRAGKANEAKETVLRAMQLGYPGKAAEYLAGRADEVIGDKEAALERYNRAIGYGLSSPEVFLSRVNLLRSMDRSEEAEVEIRSLEEMFQDNVRVQNECVEFYYALGMHQQCIETSERVIKLDRSSAGAWSRRGLSLLALRRYDDAITSLEAALKMRKDSETVQGLKEAYNAKGDKKSMIRAIDLLMEFKGTDKSLLLEKGDVLAESGKQLEALSAYQTAVDRFGLNEEAVIRKAGILHDQKKYQDELETLLEFLKTDEKRPAVLSMIARAYHGMKRYSDALEYADRAMQIEPDNPRHLDIRAQILYSLNRFEEAERNVDIALSLSPKDPNALEIKGNILIEDGRYSQALEILNGALAGGICNQRIYKNRGDSLLRLERYSEALDSYTKALKEEPQNTGALLGKGICELNLEKYSSATLSLNELTKKDPENGNGWYYFGLALKSQRIHSEAKRAFSQAIKLDDTLDMAWYELGEMLMESGELDDAETAFMKSIECAPHNREAQEELEACRDLKKKQRAEENAISLLKLEYEMNRNPTKEEAFSVCKIPMDEIDLAFDLIREPTALAVPSSGDRGWKEVEERSAAVLAKCFRNRETASYGVRLCDIMANFPSFTLDEAKQIFEYIARVQKLSVIDAVEDEKFEKLMKKATRLRREDRSLIGIISNLGVGIYTAKLIEGSLAAMGTSGYTTDFVSFSDSDKQEKPALTEQGYDQYAVRRELYEQFYGQPNQHQEEAQSGGSAERCLYHGEEAIGACSSCQTNICNGCLSVTGGHCPNCGVVLMSEEAGDGAAY